MGLDKLLNISNTNMFNSEFMSVLSYVMQRYKRSVVRYNDRLESQCSKSLGVSAMTFRIGKNIVHLVSLLLAGYSISEGLDPFLALIFAAIVISGPEMVEWYLVNKDYYETKERHDDEN